MKKIKSVKAWGVYEAGRFQHLAIRPKRKLYWVIKKKRGKLNGRDSYRIEVLRVLITPINNQTK